MKLTCGYVESPEPTKKRKLSAESPPLASPLLLSPGAQQATPAVTPSPPTKSEVPPMGFTADFSELTEEPMPTATTLAAAAATALSGSSINSNQAASAASSLLSAGNLNNINLSHLVNNLSGLGTDLSLLGGLASLSNLATLANLPIDLNNLGSLGSLLERKDDKTADSNTTSNNTDTANNDNNANSTSTNNNAPPPGGIPSPLGDTSSLNMLDLRLMFHYTSQVSGTITGAGISDTNIWNYDIPMLAFEHPFLMHLLLAFSATHLSRTEKGLDQCVTSHRGDALRLLREAVLNINADNTDALVASALILIMDALANASFPSSTSPKLLPALAWIFHVKGAATILTAVWPLTERLRFYKFISVDLGDIGELINQRVNIRKDGDGNNRYYTDLECHDLDIEDLFPVEIESPYLITLAYLNKLHKERYKSDFILRIFAFPALLDKSFLSLLMTGDVKAMRIMRSYYKLLRSFTTELKDKVWFLEGVSQVLPVDVEEYAGGAGGMTMMLDFLGGGPLIVNNEIDEEISKFDPSGLLATKLADTDNLPSDITSNLDVMRDGVFDMK